MRLSQYHLRLSFKGKNSPSRIKANSHLHSRRDQNSRRQYDGSDPSRADQSRAEPSRAEQSRSSSYVFPYPIRCCLLMSRSSSDVFLFWDPPPAERMQFRPAFRTIFDPNRAELMRSSTVPICVPIRFQLKSSREDLVPPVQPKLC